MAETKVTSDIQQINSPIKDVYLLLSDFNRIGGLINIARSMGQLPKIPELADKIEDVKFSDDTCTIILKGGAQVSIIIADKEEPKLIKLCSSSDSPLGFIIWIQLVEKGPYDTRMRITVHAEMNFMMKMMLKGKLEKGINQLAEGLSKIPYSLLANSSGVSQN